MIFHRLSLFSLHVIFSLNMCEVWQMLTMNTLLYHSLQPLQWLAKINSLSSCKGDSSSYMMYFMRTWSLEARGLLMFTCGCDEDRNVFIDLYFSDFIFSSQHWLSTNAKKPIKIAPIPRKPCQGMTSFFIVQSQKTVAGSTSTDATLQIMYRFLTIETEMLSIENFTNQTQTQTTLFLKLVNGW